MSRQSRWFWANIYAKGYFLKAIKAKAALGSQANRLPSGPCNAIVWPLFYAALTRPYKKKGKKI